MKAESTIMPVSPFEIEIVGDEAEVTLIENIEEQIGTDEREKSYIWDEYRLRVRNRPGLVKSIENSFEAWLQSAKELDYNKAAKEVRAKRDKLLAESDKVMCLDRLGLSVPNGSTFSAWLGFLKSLGNALSGEWAEYRQALRDIPEQPGFPYEVEFPEKPE